MASSWFPLPEEWSPPQPLSTLPGNYFSFEEIARDIMKDGNKTADEIVAKNKPGQTVNYLTSVYQLGLWRNRAAMKWFPIRCARLCSPDHKVVEAAMKAEIWYSCAQLDFLLRQDVWDVVRQFHDQVEATSWFDIGLRQVDRQVLAHEYNLRVDLGLGGDEERAKIMLPEIRKLEARLRLLKGLYSKTVDTQPQPVISLSESELAGLSSEFLQQRASVSGDRSRLCFTLTEDTVFRILRDAHNPHVRARVLATAQARWQNVTAEFDLGQTHPLSSIFDQIIQSENELARLKGFRSKSAEMVGRSLAESVDGITSFLDSVSQAVTPELSRLVAQLVELKMKDCHEVGAAATATAETDKEELGNFEEIQPFLLDPATLHHADFLYYLAKLDHQQSPSSPATGRSKPDPRPEEDLFAEYFPFPIVLNQLASWTNDELGLVFCDLSSSKGSPRLWDKNVQALGVWADPRSNARTKERSSDEVGPHFFGTVYLDPFARQNKRAGGWLEPFYPKSSNDDSTQFPAVILSLDLVPAADGGPTLMSIRDVSRLLGLWGEMIAQLLGTNYGAAEFTPKHSRFAEFGPIIGHAFSRLAWEPRMLELLSYHYATVPDEGWEEIWRKRTQKRDDPLPEPVPSHELIARQIGRQGLREKYRILGHIRDARFDQQVTAYEGDLSSASDLGPQFASIAAQIIPTKGSLEPLGEVDQAGNLLDRTYLGSNQFVDWPGQVYRDLYARSLGHDVSHYLLTERQSGWMDENESLYLPGKIDDDMFLFDFVYRIGSCDPYTLLRRAMGQDINHDRFLTSISRVAE